MAPPSFLENNLKNILFTIIIFVLLLHTPPPDNELLVDGLLPNPESTKINPSITTLSAASTI